MSKTRKRYSAQEKAKIVLDVLRGELTQSQITAKYGVHNTQLHQWKKQALEGIVNGFSGNPARQAQDQNALIEELYKQIGQLKVELNWLKKKLPSSIEQRRSLMDWNGEISIRRQCELLGISRSSLYDEPVEINEYTGLLL